MSGRFAIALLLTLQVSLCLSELPEPDKELVDKYDELKGAVIKRIQQVYNKAHSAISPHLEESQYAKTAKGYVEEVQERPGVKNGVKIVTGMAQEVVPLVDKARSAGLGLYGKYVRPYVGPFLDQCITNFRTALESVWPAEH
ncbi:apolipoprotein A-II [Brienomyrus brachyistius]|uniref:apolipoprotein A-II n=1 Tax=Brienomyrus brachyistius TaxID=42636 RepID=UPI0020B2DFC3|nr:apolipoprotein A-II [Brienomyrus brachyistius]